MDTPPCRNGASKWNWSSTWRAQQLAHLAELGEHERPLVGVEQLGDEFVEARELAGPSGEARAVAERVGGVVADLLEARQRGEHETAPPHALGLFGVGEQLVDDLLVERRLLAGELGVGDLLDLVGQVGEQPPVGLGAPQDERLREPAQPRRRVGVAVALDRRAEALAEPAAGCRAGRG